MGLLVVVIVIQILNLGYMVVVGERGLLAAGWELFGNALGGLTPPITSTPNDVRNSATSITSAGSSFTFLGPSAEAIIKTLDSVSDVRILSAPSVLVRNNVEADFNSGQQIPVASTILNNNGNTNQDNTYSQVQFRQTGVSLKVKPRISSNGMVFMEITQDVSSPSASGPVIGGNVSVDNNKLHTEVAVQSGDTIALAGLIKTEQGNGSGGIPYLSRLPVIGALFGTRSVRDNRQEILVLITPTVIRDPAEARRYTDEYGDRFVAGRLPKDGKAIEDYGNRIFRNPGFTRSMTPEEKLLREIPA